MNSIRASFSVLAGLVVLLIAQLAYYYPQLPDTVASHFGVDGEPNGWMSKKALVVILGFVALFSAGSTAGIAILLPKIQDSVNVPNKAYWMSPERRDDTMAFIGSTLLWIECAVVMLLLIVNYYVCRFNIAQERTLELQMFPTLGIFFAVLAFFLIRLIVKFRKVEHP